MTVSPSLVKRRKTHFHNLPCGATIILGNNGYIWIAPISGEENEDSAGGGYEQNLEVRNFHVFFLFPCKVYLTWPICSLSNDCENVSVCRIV